MAQVALNDTEQAAQVTVAYQVLRIPLGAITLGERIRPIDPVWAAALGRIMAVDGQDDPIEVYRLPGRSGYCLNTGGHRFTGAQLESWTHIDAILVSADALTRRKREIGENLWHKGLGPLDRAAFVAELVSIQRALSGLDSNQDGRTVSAQIRWEKALKVDATDASVTMTLAYGWAENVGEQLDLSRKTIYRALELHRGLKPDVVAQLRGHPTAKNAGQLRALARLNEADQRAVAAMLTAGSARSVTEALGLMRQTPKASPSAKRLSAFLGAYSRMEGSEKYAALQSLQGLKLPRGCKIIIAGDVDE